MLIYACVAILVSIVIPALLIQRSQSATADSRLKAGDRAPDFALQDQTGRTVRLSDYRGKKNLVLAFFIKAGTPG
jgi:cytochrome oxidase Cu insertion factor (SCO1/SenC/PrrC family)